MISVLASPFSGFDATTDLWRITRWPQHKCSSWTHWCGFPSLPIISETWNADDNSHPSFMACVRLVHPHNVCNCITTHQTRGILLWDIICLIPGVAVPLISGSHDIRSPAPLPKPDGWLITENISAVTRTRAYIHTHTHQYMCIATVLCMQTNVLFRQAHFYVITKGKVWLSSVLEYKSKVHVLHMSIFVLHHCDYFSGGYIGAFKLDSVPKLQVMLIFQILIHWG